MSRPSDSFEDKLPQKVEETKGILSKIGLPSPQQNDRSALTLLALLDLKPRDRWSDAGCPLLGITPIMEFIAKFYEKNYKPNTRETFRRQTIHQFVEAGIVIRNPDDYSRPLNSPHTVYQIEESTLELLKSYDTDGWTENLKKYLKSLETLKKRYAQEREMVRIPVNLPSGKSFYLSPGGQNLLIDKIIKDFCSLFTPDGKLIYVGDAADKGIHFEIKALEKLGVTIDSHGKMPDVVVYYQQKNWLVLVEAVTTHGPIDPKRLNELKILFGNSKAHLVFVTAFRNRNDMKKYLQEISWETEVWVDEPTHMIHFNGKRFLEPY
ncbi:BsuBI/PstI family type II restriction endonuclease [Phormidium sp. CCY1219]|uniref:BsuBI/PstI family type II restriction endonuclease n=1 Tax=Phormidium sp. CCY1219 TaxID=2886104 RepID=UPI002D1E97F6|nr:BsuBI/PstI family type II restriction endonuclease [Phormidium sp. CCY1219]MEB3826795.1 hypothetical protein [Phormidium sp. CCY1219]